MTDSAITKRLMAQDFNADKYVQELFSNCVGGMKLQEQRQKVQAIADETNSMIKKNVYENYMQFIEASKDISYLESEMYQLSYMLSEQRSLLGSLLSTSFVGDDCSGANVSASSNIKEDSEAEVLQVADNVEEDDRRRKLAALLEKIEGCGAILEDQSRTLLHEGDLYELDPFENNPLQRVRGCLLNDGILIAPGISGSRSSSLIRYKFEKFYELDHTAVVNIRDLGSIKYAFKLLIFPDTRIFQCPNSQSKKVWLDAIDSAKKSKIIQEKHKRESAALDVISRPTSRFEKGDSLESTNPFSDDYDSPPQLEHSPYSLLEPPTWVLDFPEEVDVFTAEHNFEAALTRINEVKEFIASCDNDVFLSRDINHKLDVRVKLLTDAVINELRAAPSHGGSRAVQRAVFVLIKLGRTTQACNLFLRHRSAVLKSVLRQSKIEGAAVLHLKHRATVFFNQVKETGKEFTSAFGQQNKYSSAFARWSQQELQSFIQNVNLNLFTSQVSLNIIAECVSYLRDQCKKLNSFGLDLLCILDDLLSSHITRAITDTKEKQLEAVKLRAQEDKWANIQMTNKLAMNKFIEDMNDLGLASAHSYVNTKELTVNLTGNTVAFSRSYMSFLEEVLQLYMPHTEVLANDAVGSIFQVQMHHVESFLSRGSKSQVQAAQRNATFLTEIVLAIADSRYQEKVGMSHPTFQQIDQHFSQLLKKGTDTVSKTRTKYSSSDYL